MKPECYTYRAPPLTRTARVLQICAGPPRFCGCPAHGQRPVLGL